MTEQNKISTNWDGKQKESALDFPKVKIPEGEHKGRVSKIELKDIPKWNQDGTEKKFLLFIELERTSEDSEKEEIPMFIPPKISKGSTNEKTGKTYSNSKLYDLLVSSDLIDKAQKAEKEQDGFTVESLQLFLSENLAGRTLRFASKLTNKGKENEYASVEKIYEVIPEEA